ncbi:MAG TPA: dihydrodipicolinate synthase family protein [bacterium]|nr:dihydrodipicolinate synthase family protein [bacterium]
MTPRGTEAFHGIFPYLVSPLDEHGRVRTRVLHDLVEHLIEEGVHGLSPLGSTGEFPYLTPEQRVEVVRTVVGTAGGRVPVVPGVAAHATGDAIQQIRVMLECGVDGIILILQSYFPLSRSAVEGFYADVAQAVPCPIVLYSNPRYLGVDLTPDQIGALSEIPNIKYAKDASGETGRILSILARVGDRLRVFSASAHIPLLVMQLGGVGWMAGPACLVPRASVALYRLAVEGRWSEGLELQRRLWTINELFQKYSLAACVKAGLQVQGFDVGDPIAPQSRLPAAGHDEIRQALRVIAGDTFLRTIVNRG